jgi:hypothetical protein
MIDGHCGCLDSGPHYPDIVDTKHIGVDDTEGRFATVELMRCARCRRLWLRYAVEYEGLTASGRWAEVPIGEDEAAAGLRDGPTRLAI